MMITKPILTGRPVMIVKGLVPYDNLGITDAHNHVCITPVQGAELGGPMLNQFDTILAELQDYLAQGGAGLASLPGAIQDRLVKKGIPEQARRQLLGGNIARWLAGIH